MWSSKTYGFILSQPRPEKQVSKQDNFLTHRLSFPFICFNETLRCSFQAGLRTLASFFGKDYNLG